MDYQAHTSSFFPVSPWIPGDWMCLLWFLPQFLHIFFNDPFLPGLGSCQGLTHPTLLPLLQGAVWRYMASPSSLFFLVLTIHFLVVVSQYSAICTQGHKQCFLRSPLTRCHRIMCSGDTSTSTRFELFPSAEQGLVLNLKHPRPLVTLFYMTYAYLFSESSSALSQLIRPQVSDLSNQ